MRVKICGITNLEDALICQRFGADAIGFIFYEKSKRYIKPEKAAKISKKLSPFLSKVGVFVNEQVENVNAIAREVGLSAVQLHGEESPEFVRQINYQVIKAFRVNSNFDFSVLEHYEDCAFLLDGFSEQVYGGSGESFNWNSVPQKWRSEVVFAGGITENNVQYLYDEIGVRAVDLSSALEIEPGKKDAQKIDRFMGKIANLRFPRAKKF